MACFGAGFLGVAATLDGAVRAVSLLPAHAEAQALRPTSRATPVSVPDDEAISLLRTFSATCGMGKADPNKAAARLAADGLVKRFSATVKGRDGTVSTRRAWTAGSADAGDLVSVFVGQTSGRGVRRTGCAVASRVPNVEDFRAKLVQSMGLDTAPFINVSTGQRTYTWPDARGPGTGIALRDTSPGGDNAVMVVLLTSGS